MYGYGVSAETSVFGAAQITEGVLILLVCRRSALLVKHEDRRPKFGMNLADGGCQASLPNRVAIFTRLDLGIDDDVEPIVLVGDKLRC